MKPRTAFDMIAKIWWLIYEPRDSVYLLKLLFILAANFAPVSTLLVLAVHFTQSFTSMFLRYEQRSRGKEAPVPRVAARRTLTL